MRMLLQRGLLLPVAGAARPSVSAARPLVATGAARAAKAATAAPAAAAGPHPRPLHSIAAAALATAHPRGAVAWLVRCCSSGGDGESAASVSGASTSAAAAAAAAAAADDSAGKEPDYLVINFYHLVDIPDTAEMMERQRKFLEDRDIRGRIYIAPTGINCQAGGSTADARAYVEWIAAQPEFQGVYYSLWPAPGHVHPKLRLKEKPSLISLAGGVDGLRVTDPKARAEPLDPRGWKEMLRKAEEINGKVDAGEEDESKRIVVLDVRNQYEWDAGHFQGAARPREEEFSETPVGDSDDDVPDYLQGLDRETPVMMYCTGGIRCDIYSAFLRQRGYKNLYTLEGGIQNYLKQTPGGEGWNGSLFVFDGRLAINPALPGGETGDAELPAAVPCQVCKTSPAKLPHMNCSNIDCNELFIACEGCRTKWQGCCCESCMAAPRLLRPIKLDGGNYATWNRYADEETMGPVMAQGRSSEGRLARRRRRRAALKEKRAAYLESRREERKATKDLMRAAMAARDTAAAAAAAAGGGGQQEGEGVDGKAEGRTAAAA